MRAKRTTRQARTNPALREKRAQDTKRATRNARRRDQRRKP
jgi:hypothetical protein